MRLPRMPLKGRNLAVLTSAASLAVASLLGGCSQKSFLDPSELGRGKKPQGDTLTVKIIDQLDPGIEEMDPQFRGAEDVRPEDLQSTPTDYAMGPGDVVDVAVTDLTGQGQETVNTRQVTESGNINLPLLKQPVKAEGLTETELAQAVTQAYKNENIITDAQVSVTLRLKRARTYSIRGAIEQPGEYEITTNDFRLLNALVQARDISRGNGNAVETIYIVRKTKAEQPATGAVDGETTAPAPKPGARDPLAPQSKNTKVQPHTLKKVALMQAVATDAPTTANTAATVPATPGETEGRYIIVDGKPVPAPGNKAAPAPAAAPPAQPRGTGAAAPSGAGGFAFSSPEVTGDQRVIRVPYNELRDGAMQYNVVIRPGDMVIIPEPRPQVYYMGGHVAAPGAYNMIPGNKLTLMDAVIAARMLDGVAIPARTDIVRRRGDEKMWVRVDLDKIFAGQQPDIYLRENDNILVGTNGVAPFIAAFRNAFRITYGFGFLYDRNFAYDRDDNDNN